MSSLPLKSWTVLSIVLIFQMIHYDAFCQMEKNDLVQPFATMTPAEIEEYELDIWKRIADLSLIPPKIITNPPSSYDYDQLDYGMTIGIEQTPGGRLWAAWVGGEDGPKAFMLAATSDDDGETWSKPRFVVDSQSSRLPLSRTVIIGNFGQTRWVVSGSSLTKQ